MVNFPHQQQGNFIF